MSVVVNVRDSSGWLVYHCQHIDFSQFTSLISTHKTDPPTPSNNLHGCQLLPTVTPSTLRSSLAALLSEMSKNGIDPDNERVLESMQQIVAGSLSGEHDDRNNSNISLRTMLLPLYRKRTPDNTVQPMSQMSQQYSTMIQDGKSDNNIFIVESYSLIKVLLRVDILQSTLLTTLIQMLPELASMFQNDANNQLQLQSAPHNNNEDIPRLIFSNIRWLDHIVDSSTLTTAFVECLTVLSSSSSTCGKTRGILLDAIATLPDVLNDYGSSMSHTNDKNNNEDDGDGEGGSSQSGTVLATLQLLRVEDPTLLIPCLDAIGSLPLSEQQLEDVTRDAMEALSTVDSWGLPALTTFLINHCPRGMARDVVEEIRKLPLGSIDGDDDGDNGGGGEDGTTRGGGSTNGSEALMIESLSRGMTHRSDITANLLKAIKETARGHHPPADIWLLACCASAPHNRTQVKSVFKSKANDGGFTSQLLRTSLCGNGVALTSLFATSLCDMADGLLRSSDSASCELGVILYEILFEEFKEPMQRQEIVGSLVTHVGSGVGEKHSEVDAAMRVFSSIVEKKGGDGGEEECGATALRPFTPFLTSLLDHLSLMTPSQVRRLFLLLFSVGGDDDDGAMARSSGSMGGSACDIVIRKHLSLAPFAKKRIGIIGTIAYAVSMSSKIMDEEQQSGMGENTEATHLPTNAAASSSPIVKEIQDMIDFAYNSCKQGQPSQLCGSHSSSGNSNTIGSSFSDGCAASFMLNELCFAVRSGRLVTQLREWLDDKFQEAFENACKRIVFALVL